MKAYAIIYKNNGTILEAFEDFEMLDVFESRKGALMYKKKIFNVKNGWKGNSFNRECKIVPVTITLGH